ncbi:MAG TPA: hypothetical protein VEG42_04575, partial [Thermoplasmata archaeon]|nr:hypothetical protein [Thermoplasmata archaeon]
GTLLGGWMYAAFGVQFAYSVAAVTVVAGGALLLPIPYHLFQLSHSPSHHRRLARSARAVSGPARANGSARR